MGAVAVLLLFVRKVPDPDAYDVPDCQIACGPGNAAAAAACGYANAVALAEIQEPDCAVARFGKWQR
jgi:hypothetical protein